MRHFALTAVGRDRPGIVAAITAVLVDHGVNVEDSQMTILRGHFTMMLVVAVPEDADVGTLGDDLDEVRGELGLDAILLSPIEELDPADEPEPTHIVTLYGADHPGIVHAVSSALADQGVSITGLETRVAGGAGSPIYVMLMEIAAGDADVDAIRSALERIGEAEGLDVSLRELSADAL